MSDGGGLESEGEMIEVVEMSFDDGRKLILDDSVNRPAGLLFAIQWYLSTNVGVSSCPTISS